MTDDRMSILKMLEDGKITSKEAARLLDALAEHSSKETASGPGRRELPGETGRLRIRVTQSGNEKVNVTFPLSLARLAVRFLPKEIDLDEIIEAVRNGSDGKLMEVHDGDDLIEIMVD